MFNNSIKKHLRERWFVTVKEGHDISGVLVHADRGDGGYLVFADVKSYPPDAEPQQMAGETWIQKGEHGNVAFLQRCLPKDL